MEIDDQSEGDVEQFHVAEQLSFVNGMHLFNGLGFDEQAIVDQQIESERLLNSYLEYLQIHKTLTASQAMSDLRNALRA